jgi:hypothetical protein
MGKHAKIDAKSVAVAKAEVKGTKKTPSKKVYTKPATPKKWPGERWALAGVAANAINEKGQVQIVKVPVLEKWLWQCCPLAAGDRSENTWLSKTLPELLNALVKKHWLATKKKSFKLRPKGAKAFLRFDRPVKVIQWPVVKHEKKEKSADKPTKHAKVEKSSKHAKETKGDKSVKVAKKK